jgi:two-component system, NtrC family, response regulator AtoC
MTMRGSVRRASAAVVISSARFAWDRHVLATLRHTTLPWDESLPLTPLGDVRSPGGRDRLSLLAQFAAHQALLHFAGIADGELDPAEWAVAQRRGSDVRLVRVAARAADASAAPPVLTLAQQFAELVGARLDVLSQSWARADAVYAEAYARLRSDVAADLRWVQRAAIGTIEAPGPDGLRLLASPESGRFGYSGEACIATLERLHDPSLRVVVLRGGSPLERYSAVRALVSDPSLTETVAADRVIAATSASRHLFVVAGLDAFDAASRKLIDILIGARHATWLLPESANALPETRWFVVSPRFSARRELENRGSWLEQFVESESFARFLEHGDVPPAVAPLPSLAEPARSYVGALALLGSRTPRALATAFLATFLFDGPLEDLVVPHVTSVEDDHYVFASDALRHEAAQLIPAASRAAICRVAATVATGEQAALLWLEAGEPANAAAALEQATWANADEVVDALHKVPRTILTPALASRYAHALIDCARYRDAREIAPHDELVLARAERRMGDYSIALGRLERMEPSVLHAEILRLTGRDDDALRVLDSCPVTLESRYERALLGASDELEPGYLATRLETYRALAIHDYEDAAQLAEGAIAVARCTTERIDAALDRLFAMFSAGRWDEARAAAVESLREVEETQGDRAAGGILFTLAYLAADDAQWARASQCIARLRHYYAGTRDDIRLRDLELLSAHLDFSRGRFSDARRAATAVLDFSAAHDQIREAAALILDEIDRVERRRTPRRSRGNSGNVELERRRNGEPPAGANARKLQAFRDALAKKEVAVAQQIAAELELVLETSDDSELRILRTASTRNFPYAPQDFDRPWCFATRNRLGQWIVIGSHTPPTATLDAVAQSSAPDWTACSDRELLYFEGASRWSTDARDAVAAIFRTRAENVRLKRIVEQEESVRETKQADAVDGIVGESSVMRDVYSLVLRVSRRDVPVCILGESGTGKELIARAIHRQSPRRMKTFTAVNCAALPENLIESELFGHVRGAFTGADRDRAGLIETTDGGTLFLDEIGELPLAAQAKLLRFLQEGEFRRVGDTVNRSADVRVVSATNRKLENAVEEGLFRDDLYYRVRGVEIALPPLRERSLDIPLLASHFLASERTRHKGGAAALSPDAEAVFVAYGWPGNVRELQNTIRAAHAMAGEAKQIEVEHLPERLRGVTPARSAAGSYQDAVSRFKRDLIEKSLAQANGNQNRAAAMLKISRQALAYQIRELGILVKNGPSARL